VRVRVSHHNTFLADIVVETSTVGWSGLASGEVEEERGQSVVMMITRMT